MKTEITLDKDALAALVKDPEVKIKLHDAVVRGVVNKVVRETSKEIEKKIQSNIDEMIKAVIHSGRGVFYQRYNDVDLTSRAIKLIDDAVNAAFAQKTRQAVYDRLNKLEDDIRKHVDETWKLLMNKDRIETVITYHIKDLIDTGLGKALGKVGE